MSISDFLARLDPDRKIMVNAIYELIRESDPVAIPRLSTMMGRTLIVFETDGIFKYGLSDSRQYVSLHIMPIYCNPSLHSKYTRLLNKARFQKGCIHFRSSDEMPLPILQSLIQEAAGVNMLAISQKVWKKQAGRKPKKKS